MLSEVSAITSQVLYGSEVSLCREAILSVIDIRILQSMKRLTSKDVGAWTKIGRYTECRFPKVSFGSASPAYKLPSRHRDYNVHRMHVCQEAEIAYCERT